MSIGKGVKVWRKLYLTIPNSQVLPSGGYPYELVCNMIHTASPASHKSYVNLALSDNTDWIPHKMYLLVCIASGLILNLRQLQTVGYVVCIHTVQF